MNKFRVFLVQYFIKVILLSIIGLLISLYVETKYAGDMAIEIKVLVDFVRMLCLAVLVAGLFSWITSSLRYLNRIQSILKEILIDRKFLASLDEKQKVETMKLLFRSDKSLEVVPNIDEYYNFYIAHIIRVANENVRTDYIVDTKIWYDQERNKVICEKHHRYKMHRNEKGSYDDIIIGVCPSDIDFELSNVIISDDNRTLEEIKNPELSEKVIEGEKAKIATIKVSRFQSEKFLNIEYVNREVGYDHWYTAAIQLLQPTYGLTYWIKCDDDIVVKSIDTFSQGASFTIQQNEKEATIISNQWINPGAGVCVIVGKK